MDLPIDRSSAAVRGYPRTARDEYIAAAAAERARLSRAIADAERREEAARLAIGAYETMLTMLVVAQREVAACVKAAEREATALLEAADREARELLREVRDRNAADHGVADDSPADDSAGAHEDEASSTADGEQPEPAASIDLPTIESFVAAPVISAPPMFAGTPGGLPSGNDVYFDYLRGALVDDEPLGPRVEEALGGARSEWPS